MKRCNVCQAVLDDDSRFCSNCGASEFTALEEFASPAEITNPDVFIAPEEHASPDVFAAPEAYTAPEGFTPPKNWGAVAAPARKSNKKWILIALAGVAVVAAGLIITLTILLNPVRQIMKSIEAQEFDKAEEIFYDKIYEDDDDYQEAYEKVAAYTDKLLEQYRNQEITYDELVINLDGIDQVGILGYELTYIYSEAEHLNFCRETFASAEAAFSNGNYQEAMNLYGLVTDGDFENGEKATEKYDESVKLFRSQAITSAEDYIKNGEYDMATMTIDDALYVLPGDSELIEAREKCLQAEYDYTIQLLIEEAQLYTSNNDYIGALTFLDETMVTYYDEARLQQEKDNCLVEFEAYVMEESLRLAKEDKFQHALNLAESGLGYFSSSQVSELAMIYRSHLPVILGEMEKFQNDTDGGSWASKTDKTNKYLEDNYSNVYENSLSVGCGSITYLVNFKYQTFTGTVGFPKGLESDGFRESATLQIYGDDALIAEFANMDEASKPQSFDLDITAYEKITLKWTCKGDNIWRDWGYFATIFDGFLVPIPLELPS